MTARYHDVVGLDFEMHHTLFVCVGQCVYHFTENPYCCRYGQFASSLDSLA